MPESTARGITYPSTTDLVRNPSQVAKLQADLQLLARTADDAVAAEGASARAATAVVAAQLESLRTTTGAALARTVSDVDERLAGLADAYDVALREGFEGTAREWLDSLQGDRGPEGPYGGTAVTDPQVASYVDEGTQTRAALDQAFVGSSRLPDIPLTAGVYGTPTGAATMEQTATGIRLTDDTTIIQDGQGRIVDGVQYLSLLRVGDHPGNWIDEWYCYVSGHGGYADPLEKGHTWLLTGPSPWGPWTWHETPLVGTGPDPYLESQVVGPRCIAPHAMWVGDEIWLTYHGGGLTQPWSEGYDYTNRWGAPSVLATSTDGVHFAEHGIVVDIDRAETRGSPYEASTSYRRTVRHNGLWHSIWQANTTNTNAQSGIATYSVGHATSVDGVNWVKRRPLIANEPGDQGPLGPTLVKVGDGWLIIAGSYRRSVGGVQVEKPRAWWGDRLEPGRFRLLGDIHLPERGGRQQGPMQSPFLFHHDGDLLIAYGSRINPSQPSVGNLAKVRWS